MRLGVNLNPGDGAGPLLAEAERLDYAFALAPEGLRDAVSTLGWAAGRTEGITLVSGACQIPARAPVLTAMTAATLDEISGGRFRLGIGVSNSHTTRGWYGLRFADPLRRTREYVEVVRMALRGEEVRYRGDHYTIPEGDADAVFRMPRPVPVPIYLAAVGPRNLELAGEIADGWIGVFLSPDRVRGALDLVRKGRERAGRTDAPFEAVLTLPMAMGDGSLDLLAGPLKRYVARFLAMGHREENFYYRIAVEMGYGAAARLVQVRHAAGDMAGAAAAVPYEFVDEFALLGSAERIAARIRAYADAGVTALCLSPYPGPGGDPADTLRAAAAAAPSRTTASTTTTTSANASGSPGR